MQMFEMVELYSSRLAQPGSHQRLEALPLVKKWEGSTKNNYAQTIKQT